MAFSNIKMNYQRLTVGGGGGGGVNCLIESWYVQCTHLLKRDRSRVISKPSYDEVLRRKQKMSEIDLRIREFMTLRYSQYCLQNLLMTERPVAVTVDDIALVSKSFRTIPKFESSSEIVSIVIARLVVQIIDRIHRKLSLFFCRF